MHHQFVCALKKNRQGVNRMIYEFCAENFTKVPQAIDAGARRIELCDHLEVGGTTPSEAVIQETLSYAHQHQTTVMVMIRPRQGNFVYTSDELDEMIQSIRLCQKLGADGVVFGCLTQDNQIDVDAMHHLITEAAGMDIVFHMAFDSIPRASQEKAIQWLAQNGVRRILTHGGPSEQPIMNNLDWLKELLIIAEEFNIEILPGGGINTENGPAIAKEPGVSQLHGTKVVPL